MRIRRRNLRKRLIAVGCVVGVLDLHGVLIGGLLLFCGSIVHLWSKGCLEQNRNLTTTGPYRWTRNPFYLANLLIDLGLCLVIGRWQLTALYVPLWWLAYRETIRREEKLLLELFPEAYPVYCASVPPFFPTGRRLSVQQAKGRFSWRNPSLAQGSEFARLLGIWLAPGLIWGAEILRTERLAILDEANAATLGLIVLLPCVWVLKLALAEIFRRPWTAIVPFESKPMLRLGVTALLLGGALFVGKLWAVSLLVLWCGLLVLDHWGRVRAGPGDGVDRIAWPYFRWIAFISTTTYGLMAVLTRSVTG